MATKYNGKKKRPFKQQITDGIAEIVNMTTNKPAKCLLCLPSIKQLDIKAFQQAGVIDHNTFIIFVEGGDASVSNIIKKIKANLARKGYKAKSVHGIESKLCDISRTQLYNVLKDNNLDGIDLVYADTCSCFNRCMIDWLESCLKPNMTEGATLVTNFLLARDVGDIPKAMWTNVKNPPRSEHAPGVTLILRKIFGPSIACIQYKAEYSSPCPMLVNIITNMDQDTFTLKQVSNIVKDLQNIGYSS